MLRNVAPSRPYVVCWDDDDVADAKRRSKRRRSTHGAVASRQQELRKEDRRERRKADFLADVRDAAGDLDLDGRDAVVSDAVAADPAFETLLTSALRAVSTAKTEVLTLAFGDLLGKIRSVACVELAARELRKRHPGVAFDRIHLDLRSM